MPHVFRLAVVVSVLSLALPARAVLHEQQDAQRTVLPDEMRTSIVGGCMQSPAMRALPADMSRQGCQCVVEGVGRYVPAKEFKRYLDTVEVLQRDHIQSGTTEAGTRLAKAAPTMNEVLRMCEARALDLK